MIKFKKYLLILIAIILQNATPTQANCKINTEITNRFFSSGRIILNPNHQFILYSDKYNEINRRYIEDITKTSELFDVTFKSQNVWDLFYYTSIFDQGNMVSISDYNEKRKYATAIIAHLKDSVFAKFCKDHLRATPFQIDISFITLQMFATKYPMERLKTRLQQIKGSYVDLKVNRLKRKVEATLIWNPRRMRRDLLILYDHGILEKKPVLPFEMEQINIFLDRQFTDPKYLNEDQVDETITSDFKDLELELFFRGADSSHISHFSLPLKFWSLDVAFVDIYTMITKKAIDLKLQEGYEQPILSLADIEYNRNELIQKVEENEEILKIINEKNLR